MKKAMILMLLSACAAHAQMWTNVETGAVAPWPSMRPANAVSVPADWYAAEGWQPFNLAQQADWDAARAAAQEQAEAEAAAQATLPMMNASGFAATNAAGHWVKFIADGTNAIAETLAIQISHSPPDPVTAAQMEADAIAAHAAKKAAAKTAKGKGKGLPALAERVAALEALNGIE